MATYRRVTRQCSKADWPQCRVHDDVAQRHGSTDLFKQFLRQDPRTWYTKKALRERRRDVVAGRAAPSTRPIGSVKTEGFRAWVWRDDGSVYDIQAGFTGCELHWMIAYGNRRVGDNRSDMQVTHAALLEDPDDCWRPSDDDYADLLVEHDEGFTERAVTAIQHAVEYAEQHHNTVVDINSDDVGGHVVHEHDEDLVCGLVVEEINERWVLLAKTRTGGRALTYVDSQTLAATAYPDGVFPEVVQQRHTIRGGLLVADPKSHYVFYAELEPKR